MSITNSIAAARRWLQQRLGAASPSKVYAALCDDRQLHSLNAAELRLVAHINEQFGTAGQFYLWGYNAACEAGL